LARPEASRVRLTAGRGDVPLAQVRDLLGHASILTKERYEQKPEALQPSNALKGGKTFDPQTEAADNLSAFEGLRNAAWSSPVRRAAPIN
jgi:hypothetical protein